MIAIIDYDAGNLKSVEKALLSLGQEAVVTRDREELLSTLLPASGVDTVINIGCDVKSSEMSIRLAEKYPYVYAAAGIHPTETKDCNQEIFQQLTAQAAMPKVVAIGEIGLDYHWDTPRDLQKKWFEKQLYLAVEKDMPEQIAVLRYGA